MNAYEKMHGPAEKQEARDLVIMYLLMPHPQSFDRAWELINTAAEFLEGKEEQRDAEGKAYWESEEGKARHKEIVERFSKKVVE